MTLAEQERSWTADLIECAARFDAERGGPDWLRARRRAGREQLTAQGLPLSRDEAWAYTSVRPLLAQRFTIGAASVQVKASGWQPPADGQRWKSALDDYPQHAFTAINQAFAVTGPIVTVDANEPRLIEIVHRAGDQPDSAPLYADTFRVELASGAHATVLEHWEAPDQSGAALHVPAVDLVVAPGATLRYYRLPPPYPDAFRFDSLRAAVNANALLDLVLIGGSMAIDRTEVTVALLAEGARARLSGAAVLSGQMHGAIHTCVQHRAPACWSDQLFKGVLLDRARSVFQGTIEVDRVAQDTDAFQLSKTLLLDPSSRADARPQLRIGADQVRCTHGATTGPLAPEQLHYLRSRGIPTGKATGILVRGFLDEVNRRVKVPEVGTLLQKQMDRSLSILETA